MLKIRSCFLQTASHTSRALFYSSIVLVYFALCFYSSPVLLIYFGIYIFSLTFIVSVWIVCVFWPPVRKSKHTRRQYRLPRPSWWSTPMWDTVCKNEASFQAFAILYLFKLFDLCQMMPPQGRKNVAVLKYIKGRVWSWRHLFQCIHYDKQRGRITFKNE
jgi:hypothetical protein